MKRDEAIAYAYKLRGSRFANGRDRKGEACAVLGTIDGRSQVRFEDGTTMFVSQMLLRRLPESAMDTPSAD